MMAGAAKALMAAGALIFLIGAGLWAASKLGLPLGRLPGDISYLGRSIKIFAPITTMLLVSIVLTLLVNIISRMKR